jgi:hypothetical protein
MARHPRWVYGVLTGEPLSFGGLEPGTTLEQGINQVFDPSATLEDVEWLRSRWEGPLVVKGVMRVDDAKDIASTGVDAIAVSNHGGRQLDRSVTPLALLPDVVEAVGDSVEVYLDGGVRCGADVAAAVALGARAAFVARPYLYALMAGGETGVDVLLRLLRDDYVRTLHGLMSSPTKAPLAIVRRSQDWTWLADAGWSSRTDRHLEPPRSFVQHNPGRVMSESPTTVIPVVRTGQSAEQLESAVPSEPPSAPAGAGQPTAPSIVSKLTAPRFAKSPTTGVWLGLVVVALGFGTIFFSWIKVAATLDVGRQMPYVVSGAMTGIGLIVVGIAVADMAVRRQDRLERRHQLALMRTVLEELREVQRSQDGDRR